VEKVLVVRRTGQEVAWNETVTCGGTTWSIANPSTRGRGLRRRAPALHHVHQRDHRQAEGHLAHLGWLPDPRVGHPSADLRPQAREDVFWTAADIGWVTGHSYIVYGPLANGTTSVMYEGTPDTPARDRWWQIIEKYKVNILYTAPTTIRTFMKWGEDLPAGHDLSSLRLLGSVGRAHQPRSVDVVPHPHRRRTCARSSTPGGRRRRAASSSRHCPGITATKPGAAMTPFPGIAVDIIDNEGNSVGNDEGGYLVITEPWPGNAARHLGRRRALQGDLLVPLSPASTSPVTGPSATRMATSGCSVGWTM
jgi:acetyl-CoA synthetase